MGTGGLHFQGRSQGSIGQMNVLVPSQEVDRGGRLEGREPLDHHQSQLAVSQMPEEPEQDLPPGSWVYHEDGSGQEESEVYAETLVA